MAPPSQPRCQQRLRKAPLPVARFALEALLGSLLEASSHHVRDELLNDGARRPGFATADDSLRVDDCPGRRRQPSRVRRERLPALEAARPEGRRNREGGFPSTVIRQRELAEAARALSRDRDSDAARDVVRVHRRAHPTTHGHRSAPAIDGRPAACGTSGHASREARDQRNRQGDDSACLHLSRRASSPTNAPARGHASERPNAASVRRATSGQQSGLKVQPEQIVSVAR